MSDMQPSILLFTGLTIGCLLAAKLLLHYFQLESYQFPGYFRTLRRNLPKALIPGAGMTVLSTLSLLLIRLFLHVDASGWLCCAVCFTLLVSGGFLIGKVFTVKKAKKAFVLTPRVRRLYAVSFAVLMLLLYCLYHLIDPTGSLAGTMKPAATAFLILFPLFLPVWTALCGLLAWPIEKAISEMYFRDAQRILKGRTDLIRIGITGSWGKTSVKFILGTILEEKYHTLVTPASFNTPMGVTRVIRSMLEPGHRIFVSEMGARHVGDIKEMCRLVHPQIGILTSVGPQHLDTFRTLERVTSTKYELINALPEDGTAFFADDDGICLKLYAKTEKDKTLAGMDNTRDDVWAENIHYSSEGSSFDLCTHEGRFACNTQLLGELNIRNILLSAAVAFKLGLNGEQISRGIMKIRPVEHRLQLIRNPGGITVIDDAFNSNIRGAGQAFKVIQSFPGRRIVVTPGMVELGDQEGPLNHAFGEAMADCCDMAVLIGEKRSRSIRSGLSSKGFPESSIHVTSSLDEATELLKKLAAPGDTILFENDLPDNYSE